MNPYSVLKNFIDQNSFSFFITEYEGEFFISHINLIQGDEDSILLGHIAASNQQARHLKHKPHAVAVFSHSSPGGGIAQPPALQVYGSINLIEESRDLKAMLDKLVQKYEGNRACPWAVDWTNPLFPAQLKGIVGFQFKPEQISDIGQSLYYPKNFNKHAAQKTQADSLYTPSSFKEKDPSILLDFIKQYPDCFLILSGKEGFQVLPAHLNFKSATQANEWVFLGTLDRNLIHPELKDAQAIAVFRGPHCYISPSWYQNPNSVPTWNYVTVHARGRFELIQNSEETPFNIQFTVSHFEGKFKLNQNRTIEDRSGVVQALQETSPKSQETQIANLMQSFNSGCPFHF